MSGPHPPVLYYDDPYLVEFEATVVERLAWDRQPAVVLDRSAFYPTSGGQPSDRGTLSGVAVVGVELREADGAVVHLLADEALPEQVTGEVDWSRRFDHMQQHTGQHLLSAACEQVLDADTVSFHLGAEVSTIDLNVARLSVDQIEQVEDLVNRAIWEDRPVTSRFVTPEEAERLPLRRPPQVEGPIRLVEIADFDINPCGGTHVARTGEIGLLKVLRPEHRGAETRLEFVCGGRALLDYRQKNHTVLGLGATLTVGHWELEQAVARLQQELKATRRELRTAREVALEEGARRLAQSATPAGGLQVVQAVLEGRPPADLRALAQKVTTNPTTLALLASLVEDRTLLCFACSPDLDTDAAAMLQVACAELGGKGGGQPHLAQGSSPRADRHRVEEVLSHLVTQLESIT